MLIRLRLIAPAVLAVLVLVTASCGERTPAEAPDQPSLSDAIGLYEAGRPREAREAALRLAKDVEPGTEDALALAGFLARLGESREAARILDGAEARSVEARELLALALVKSGDAPRCRGLLEALPVDHVWGTTGLMARAFECQSRGKTLEAQRFLDEAQGLSGDNPEIWAWRGWLQHATGDSRAAERHLREGLRRFPDSWEVRAMLSAVVFALRGEERPALEEVVELCGFVRVRHPFDLSSRRRLGMALNRLGRHVHAVDVWQEIVDDFPTDASHWTNLGISQMRAGRVLGAVKCFQKADRLAPQDPAILINLGKAYLEQAREVKYERESLELAESTFAKVLSLDPGNLAAKLGRARSLVRLNPKNDEVVLAARVLYEEALAADPENFEALLNVALLYYDLRLGSGGGRGQWYWKAMEYFRKAEAIRPPSEWDHGARNAYEDLKKM